MFLRHHDLQDFKLVFKPSGKNRRAKRGVTIVEADPFAGKVMGKNRTFQELLERLYAIAPDIAAWVSPDSRPRYWPVLTLIDRPSRHERHSKTLGELRVLREELHQASEQRAREVLQEAFIACDKLVDQQVLVRIAQEFLDERRGK